MVVVASFECGQSETRQMDSGFCFVDVFGLPVGALASFFLSSALSFAGSHGSLGGGHYRGHTLLFPRRICFDFLIVHHAPLRYLAVWARFMVVIASFAVEEGSARVAISPRSTTFLF